MTDQDELTETESFITGPRVTMPVEYNQRDLMVYALGIGCSDPRYVYEHDPNFAAFPTYPFCFLFKGTSFDVLPFPPPVMLSYPKPHLRGYRVSLDAEKYLEKFAELPRGGAQLRMVGGLVGVHNKGKGALVESSYDIVDSSGKVYYRLIAADFYVGCTGFRDAGASHSQMVPPPADRPPTYTVEVPTDPNIASLFRLSGDYNPLHVDPTFAGHAGFDRPILHGLCTLGHTTRAVLDVVAGGDQRRYRSVQMRFASPVVAGQQLVVEIWMRTPVEAVFRTRVKETGAVCVSNGLMRLHPASSL